MGLYVFGIAVGIFFITLAQQTGALIPTIILLFALASLAFDLPWGGMRLVYIMVALAMTGVFMMLFKRR